MQYNDGFRTELIGTAEQVAERIIEYRKLGVDLILTGFLHYHEEVSASGASAARSCVSWRWRTGLDPGAYRTRTAGCPSATPRCRWPDDRRRTGPGGHRLRPRGDQGRAAVRRVDRGRGHRAGPGRRRAHAGTGGVRRERAARPDRPARTWRAGPARHRAGRGGAFDSGRGPGDRAGPPGALPVRRRARGVGQPGPAAAAVRRRTRRRPARQRPGRAGRAPCPGSEDPPALRRRRNPPGRAASTTAPARSRPAGSASAPSTTTAAWCWRSWSATRRVWRSTTTGT